MTLELYKTRQNLYTDDSESVFYPNPIINKQSKSLDSRGGDRSNFFLNKIMTEKTRGKNEVHGFQSESEMHTERFKRTFKVVFL